MPSRDEFRVPSQDAPLYSGAEAVTNDGTAAGQCIGTNLTSTPPLQISPPMPKETGGCERLIDDITQKPNTVLAVIGEKPGNSDDEPTSKGDVVAKSMGPSDSIAQRPINMPQTTDSRPSVSRKTSNESGANP